MENPSFNIASSVPGTEAPVDNNWSKFAEKLNEASAEFQDTATADTTRVAETLESADEAVSEAAATVNEVNDAIEAATADIERTTEPARITGTNKDDEAFVAKVTGTNKDEEEPFVAKVTGTNKDTEDSSIAQTATTITDDNLGKTVLESIETTDNAADDTTTTQAIINSPNTATAVQETVTEIDQTTQTGETKENSERSLNLRAAQYEFFQISQQLDKFSKDKESNQYRELWHRYSILFDAIGILLHEQKDSAQVEPASMQQVFTEVAKYNMNRSNELRTISDNLNSKEIFPNPLSDGEKESIKTMTRSYERQADAFAVRSLIAEGLANGDFDNIKQKYLDHIEVEDRAS